jgi:S-adenosylhomocysteine hydrolase
MIPTAAATATDFKVADLSLTEFGRKEITLVEHEMPGLMTVVGKGCAESLRSQGAAWS